MASRDEVLSRAMALPLLDAIVAVVIFNEGWGSSSRRPKIDLSDVLPPMPDDVIEASCKRVRQMIDACVISYPGNQALREYKELLVAKHPGFSEDSYDAALWSGFATMR